MQPHHSPLQGCSAHQNPEPHIVAQECTILKNDVVNSEYRHLIVACSEKAARAVPGQFFHLLCPQANNEHPFFRRPMSLYGADLEKKTVEFLYKVTGAGTRGLATLKVGDALNIMGPLGNGFSLEPTWKNIVVVGRGVGLATLAPLAKLAKRQAIGVTAVFSARHPDFLMSVDLFESQGAKVISLVDTDASSNLDNVEQILRKLIENKQCDAFFTCGSARLMKLQQKLVFEYNISGQAALEEHMACGMGLCYCCVRNFNIDGKTVSRRICWDGPVFDLREVLS